MPNSRLNDVPQLIKFVRKNLRHMTQMELAERLRTSPEVVYNYENGRTPLTIETKAVIFNVLNITPSEVRLFYIAQRAKVAE